MTPGPDTSGQSARSRPVRLLQLKPRRCRWPLGGLLDRAEFFCGEPTVEDCSWCAKHRVLAFVGPAKDKTRVEAQSSRAMP
jgi:hypothetical protein